MPNQPKTPVRGFRIPDALYEAAKDAAKTNGEDLSAAIRKFLEGYVRRTRKRQESAPPAP